MLAQGVLVSRLVWRRHAKRPQDLPRGYRATYVFKEAMG